MCSSHDSLADNVDAHGEDAHENNVQGGDNVIVLVTDRMNLNDLGAYGNSWIETSAFDALAAESLLFDQYYSCSCDLESLYHSLWQGLSPALKTFDQDKGTRKSLPAFYRQLGYRTVLLTDDESMIEHPLSCHFEEVCVWEPPKEDFPADSVDETHFYRCFVQMIEKILALQESETRPFFLWVHLSGFQATWDFPLSVREYYRDDESDPAPYAGTTVPYLVWNADFQPLSESFGQKTEALFGKSVLLDQPVQFDETFLLDKTAQFNKTAQAKETSQINETDQLDKQAPFDKSVHVGELSQIVGTAQADELAQIAETVQAAKTTRFDETPTVSNPDQTPEETLLNKIQGIREAYNGGMSVWDESLELLTSTLKETQILDRSLLILTSTRGFPLGEHGRIGSVQPELYAEECHLPLLIRFPENKTLRAERSSALCDSSDLFLLLTQWPKFQKECDLLSNDLSPSTCSTPGVPESTQNLVSTVLNDESVLHESLVIVEKDASSEKKALVTPEWFLKKNAVWGEQSPFKVPEYELFVLPDDRLNVNEVSSRCENVLEELRPLLEKGRCVDL